MLLQSSLLDCKVRGSQRARQCLHHLLTHLVLPSLDLREVKQDTVAIPVVLVTLYLLVAFVAKECPTRPAGHFVTAFTSLNGHATGRTLLARFLQREIQRWEHHWCKGEHA